MEAFDFALATARRAVEAAAAVALAHFRHGVAGRGEGRSIPVTVADRESERAIFDVSAARSLNTRWWARRPAPTRGGTEVAARAGSSIPWTGRAGSRERVVLGTARRARARL